MELLRRDPFMKLVLVEGFPGSGKSTTAQWIATQIERQGQLVRWFYEYHAFHPVCDTRPDAFAHYGTWDEFVDERLNRWTSFVAAADDEVTIFDSALLQNLILIVLRRMVDADAIVGFIRKIGDVIRPLAPRLVYFSQADPDAAYRAMCKRRGPAYTESVVRRYDASPHAERHGFGGMEGLLAYWREHKATSDRAVVALDLPTLVVDPSCGDWGSRRRSIGRFLNFPVANDPRPAPADLKRYVGRYRVRWRGEIPLDWARIYSISSRAECSVTLKEGNLFLNDLLWPDNRLIPKAANVFYAESWPLQVVFEEGPDGRIHSLIVQGDTSREV